METVMRLLLIVGATAAMSLSASTHAEGTYQSRSQNSVSLEAYKAAFARANPGYAAYGAGAVETVTAAEIIGDTTQVEGVELTVPGLPLTGRPGIDPLPGPSVNARGAVMPGVGVNAARVMSSTGHPTATY